jgi:DNA-directed RNA polymerase specialized sigma24 family protein
MHRSRAAYNLNFEIRRGLAHSFPDQVGALLLHHERGGEFREIAGMPGITAAAARARASRGQTCAWR